METAENLCLGFRLLEERNFAKVSGRLKTSLHAFVRRKPIAAKTNAKGSLKTVFGVSGCLVV